MIRLAQLSGSKYLTSYVQNTTTTIREMRQSVGILAVLVAAATAMAPTACTTADPDDPGTTSTSMPGV